MDFHKRMEMNKIGKQEKNVILYDQNPENRERERERASGTERWKVESFKKTEMERRK